MNRNEVLGVMSVLKAAYPSFYRGMSRTDAESAVNLWCDVFRDDNAAQVGMSVKAFISEDSKGFPPAPGQIRAYLPKSGLKAIEGPEKKRRDDMRKRYAELVNRRRLANLPATWEEAQKVGMKAAEWSEALDKAGLSVETIL